MPSWTFITNHGAVLALVAKQGQITGREIANILGITERSVLRIISDLETDGYVTRTREGRLNHYQVDHEMPMLHPQTRDVVVGELLKVIMPSSTE